MKEADYQCFMYLYCTNVQFDYKRKASNWRFVQFKLYKCTAQTGVLYKQKEIYIEIKKEIQ